ncbi:LacI family DNA-binding transcriptional regulator [Kribbella sp. NPDC056861]|uniref:LacI family DNA-binding transcriptional regulator n=1 Tax=Kribbella sp. NPDC056861 TaxID=3154857 RepID=UPI003437DBC1
MARVTSRDVAREAGVSQTTVSFVLNDRSDQTISDATRQAVLGAARRLGYVPSGAARSLRKGRSSVVLCVLPDLPVAQAMEEFKLTLSGVLGESGLTCVFLHDVAGLPLAQLWPDVHPAVVVAFGGLTAADAKRIRNAGIALIDGLFDQQGTAITGLDQADVGAMQVQHLAARGHTRIGFGAVRDPREAAFCDPRMRGAQQACRELGLPQPVVQALDYTAADGLDAVRRWTASPEQVTAIAAFNDLVGLAVLAGARAAGITVPADLAVIGVDNLPAAALAEPPLTTIAFDATVSARTLARRVLAEAGVTAPPPEPLGPALRLIPGSTT